MIQRLQQESLVCSTAAESQSRTCQLCPEEVKVEKMTTTRSMKIQFANISTSKHVDPVESLMQMVASQRDFTITVSSKVRNHQRMRCSSPMTGSKLSGLQVKSALLEVKTTQLSSHLNERTKVSNNYDHLERAKSKGTKFSSFGTRKFQRLTIPCLDRGQRMKKLNSFLQSPFRNKVVI